MLLQLPAGETVMLKKLQKIDTSTITSSEFLVLSSALLNKKTIHYKESCA
jgi:hypothetical protein